MTRRFVRLLSRPSTLITLAAASFLAADLVLIFVIGPIDFAFDFWCCYQQAGERAITDPSTLYVWSDTYTFRYTPLGALLFVPLVPLSAGAAAWAWIGIKLVVLGVAARWYSRPWSGVDRWLVLLAVVTFPPIVHDLVIGNVSTITAARPARAWRAGQTPAAASPSASSWPSCRSRTSSRCSPTSPSGSRGPSLRRSARSACRSWPASPSSGSSPGWQFAGTLREPLERTFTANIGFSGLLGPVGVVVGVLVAGAIFVVGVLTGGARGYGLGIIAGIVAGPYTFIHYLAGTIVAAEPVLRMRPRRLAAFPSLLLVTPLVPLWLVALAGSHSRLACARSGSAAPGTALMIDR